MTPYPSWYKCYFLTGQGNHSCPITVNCFAVNLFMGITTVSSHNYMTSQQQYSKLYICNHARCSRFIMSFPLWINLCTTYQTYNRSLFSTGKTTGVWSWTTQLHLQKSLTHGASPIPHPKSSRHSNKLNHGNFKFHLILIVPETAARIT